MAKSVYLVISDLHDIDKVKENRQNYSEEIWFVKNKIISLIKQYKEVCDNVNLILLGDVFDRGYKGLSECVQANNFWVYLMMNTNKIYSVLGNHETSFYKNNPFYSLVTEIESQEVQKLSRKVWTPKGLISIVTVPDRIDEGNVHFYFNHSNCKTFMPDTEGYNIGLFHQDIITKDIIYQMHSQRPNQNYRGLSCTNFDKSGIFENYDLCYFGHMHTIYGTWNYENDLTGHKTKLSYLASLGRPNVTEVSNDFLQRNIPAIIINEGEFEKVESNYFDLPSYEECVKEEIVLKNQEKYQRIATLKRERDYIPEGDNPIQNILDRCANNEVLLQIATNLLYGRPDEIDCQLQQEIDRVQSMEVS